MNIHFLSFGTTWNYQGALQRVTNQITAWQNQQNEIAFKSIAICSEHTLVQQFPDFVKTHLNFLQSHPRGFGYWLWKSFLIKQRLNAMPTDDVLFYMDIGCQLNFAAHHRFTEYYNMAQDTGLLCFKVGMPEYQWCKADTGNLIAHGDINIMNTSQMVGGVHMIKNTPLNFDMVSEWYEIAYKDNYRYLDDSASIAANHVEFQEHRHDQAIFSLLVKKYNQHTALDDETWKPNWHVDGVKSPIWATRNHNLNLI